MCCPFGSVVFDDAFLPDIVGLLFDNPPLLWPKAVKLGPNGVVPSNNSMMRWLTVILPSFSSRHMGEKRSRISAPARISRGHPSSSLLAFF